jgi:hypothetical protein
MYPYRAQSVLLSILSMVVTSEVFFFGLFKWLVGLFVRLQTAANEGQPSKQVPASLLRAAGMQGVPSGIPCMLLLPQSTLPLS